MVENHPWNCAVVTGLRLAKLSDETFADEFRYETVTADDIVDYISERAGTDYTYFFDQYLKHSKIPQLEISVTQKDTSVTARYKWNADVKDFNMPVKITTSEDTYEFIYPIASWQSTKLGHIRPEKFRVAEDRFYIDVKLSLVYIDPDKTD